MFKMAVESNIGDVVVKTTVNRGLAPAELAERAVEQIVSVSSSVDPVVRQQAEAFKNRIYHVILGIIIGGRLGYVFSMWTKKQQPNIKIVLQWAIPTFPESVFDPICPIHSSLY